MVVRSRATEVNRGTASASGERAFARQVRWRKWKRPASQAAGASSPTNPLHWHSDKRTDTVGEVGSGGEGGEAGSAGGGARDRPEPGREPLEVDRGRGRHVLQVRLGQPPIAAAAQPEGAHPL